MTTTGSKWFFGLSIILFVLAAAYGWTTGGNGLGPLTLGYKGGVGDHLGYGLLVASAVVSLGFGVLTTAIRDAEAVAVAQVAGRDTVPPVTPAGTSYWPPVAAFGLALVVIGLVSEPVFVVFGLVVVGIALLEWTVQAWADRATGDPETNRRIRNRLMNPIEFPVGGVLGAAVVVFALSRVFLALSADSAVWVGVGCATVILLGGALFAARPRISSNVVVGVLFVVAVAVLAVGIAATFAGTREFEEHEGEGSGAEIEAGLGASLEPDPSVEVAR